jgi:hypothetical protein
MFQLLQAVSAASEPSSLPIIGKDVKATVLLCIESVVGVFTVVNR